MGTARKMPCKTQKLPAQNRRRSAILTGPLRSHYARDMKSVVVREKPGRGRLRRRDAAGRIAERSGACRKKTVARKLAQARAEVARLQRAQEKEAAAGLLEERAEVERRIAADDSVIARGRKARAGEMRRRRNVDERIKTARKNGLIPPESETGVPPAPVEKPERNAPPEPRRTGRRSPRPARRRRKRK